MTTQQTPRDVIDGLIAFVDQQECARASAQALANQREQTINAVMETLTKAGIANDAPLPDLVARLVSALRRACAERDAAYQGVFQAARDMDALTKERDDLRAALDRQALSGE